MQVPILRWPVNSAGMSYSDAMPVLLKTVICGPHGCSPANTQGKGRRSPRFGCPRTAGTLGSFGDPRQGRADGAEIFAVGRIFVSTLGPGRRFCKLGL